MADLKKPCPPNQERSDRTRRCIKKCLPGQVRNETGHCRRRPRIPTPILLSEEEPHEEMDIVRQEGPFTRGWNAKPQEEMDIVRQEGPFTRGWNAKPPIQSKQPSYSSDYTYLEPPVQIASPEYNQINPDYNEPSFSLMSPPPLQKKSATPPVTYSSMPPLTAMTSTYSNPSANFTTPLSSVASLDYNTPDRGSDVQSQINDLKSQLKAEHAVRVKMQTYANANFQANRENHQEFKHDIDRIDAVVRTIVRPNYVLLGYNMDSTSKRIPVFAKSISQQFDTKSLAAIGASTNPTQPFYFVFRQLVHLQGNSAQAAIPINLYEINQFSHFCDHDLNIVVPLKTLAPNNVAGKLRADSTVGEKWLHTTAATNNRRVTYADAVAASMAPVAAPAAMGGSRRGYRFYRKVKSVASRRHKTPFKLF